MNGHIYLKNMDVSEELFNRFFEIWGPRIYIVDNFNDYVCGHKNKNQLICNKEKTKLIVSESHLNYLVPQETYTPWKQVILNKVADVAKDNIETSVAGNQAFYYILKILKKYYSEIEIKNILDSYKNEYDENLKQFHYISFGLGYHEIENVVKYDINGAHTDAVITMFPKAKTALKRLYAKRKENPKIKKYFNFFVGYLKKIGYDGAYNWIVQRTTNKLLDGIEAVGGELIYANTDGFAVKNPEHYLEASTELGEFKEEFKGTLLTYVDENYWCFETDGKLTGNVLTAVREKINLKEKRIVHYEKIYLAESNTFTYTNLKEEIIDGKEDKN